MLSALKKNIETVVPGAIKVPEPAPAQKPGPRYGLRRGLQEPKVEPKKVAAVKKPRLGPAGKPRDGSAIDRLSRPKVVVLMMELRQLLW